MKFNMEVQQVKLKSGITLIGGLINDGIIGKNYISLGDPTEIKTKKKHMEMKRCIPIQDGLQIFNIPNGMIKNISEPDDATFQKYHDEIIIETVLNEPKIH